MGRRISKEFLHPSILEGVNNKIGNLDSLETDAKGNMVQAINELVEKLDNSAEIEAKEVEIAEGKELIANAVGEPLTAEESFDEMSNDINGLLSTFKTNMMNNGVTVESGDKFKQLIDKIATMVEEGEGKGIRYAEGVAPNKSYRLYNGTTDYDSSVGSTTGHTSIIDINLDFTPQIVFLTIPFLTSEDGTKNSSSSNFVISNLYESNVMVSTRTYGIRITEVTNNHITIQGFKPTSTVIYYNLFMCSPEDDDIKYYAIGVGEEDTTLRDSLASILENKGVDVTEEDDMASLITKVDSIIEYKLDSNNTEGSLVNIYSQYPSRFSTSSYVSSWTSFETTTIKYSGVYKFSVSLIGKSSSYTMYAQYKIVRNNGVTEYITAGSLQGGNLVDPETFVNHINVYENDIVYLEYYGHGTLSNYTITSYLIN